MNSTENLSEESGNHQENDVQQKSSNSKYIIWSVVVVLLIVWIDSMTDSAFGIISAFANPEHAWYENIINEFTPSPTSGTEWGDAIKHGLGFPINFIINWFIDHPYKVETDKVSYNSIFWITAGLEIITVIRKLLFKK